MMLVTQPRTMGILNITLYIGIRFAIFVNQSLF